MASFTDNVYIFLACRAFLRLSNHFPGVSLMFRSFQGTLREMSLPLASYASFLSVDVCLTSYIHTYLPTLFILHGKIFSLYYDIKFSLLLHCCRRVPCGSPTGSYCIATVNCPFTTSLGVSFSTTEGQIIP